MSVTPARNMQAALLKASIVALRTVTEVTHLCLCLHRSISHSRHGLNLNLCHISSLPHLLLTHRRHAGRRQARGPTVGGGGDGGDAAQVGGHASFAARVDAARQAGRAYHRGGGGRAHALHLALQEVRQHLAFALHTHFAAAHQVVVGVQQAVDFLRHLDSRILWSTEN